MKAAPYFIIYEDIMRYTARNLFLLVLMGYSLSALPLNPELATLDLSRFSYENALKNQSIQGRISYAYILNTSQNPLVNPEKTDFLIRAEGGKKPKWKEAPELTLEVINGGKLLKTLKGNAFSTYALSKEAFNPYELKYSLNLSRKALDLDGSSYTLRISCADPALSQVKPLEIPVQYMDALKYKPALTSAASGKQMIVSYYPDISGKFAVPISREVPRSSKLFRTAVNQLLTAPPAAMGLKTEILVPRVSSIQYASGLVNCQLSGPVPPVLYTDSQLAATAQKTLVDTIASIESPYKISKVRFSWNGVPPVPGWGLDEIGVPTAAKAWLALSVKSNYVLLVPTPVDNATPETLFAILKKGDDGLMPTVPGQASLLSTHMEGDVMILTFASGFKGLFENAPDQAALLIDSLTNTYATLPGVKYLRLVEKNERIQSLGGSALPDTLQATPYVNPEKAFTP